MRDRPDGPAVATLIHGQSISVERTSDTGRWAYGFAYGQVNRHRWVLASYLGPCPAPALGHRPEGTVVVPAGRLASVPRIPADGTLVRERSAAAVLMEGGLRRLVPTPAHMEALGLDRGAVRVAPDGRLGGVPRGADLPMPAGGSSEDAPQARAARAGRAPACGPFTAVARARDTHVAIIRGTGTRVYSVGVTSYLQRCPGGFVRIRHGVYVDTRSLPYGFRVYLRVSSRRSDGRWAAAHRGYFLSLKGTREIQEVLLVQTRGTSGGRTITDVHVKHCGCALGSGAVPLSSTATARVVPYGGPEARPRD